MLSTLHRRMQRNDLWSMRKHPDQSRTRSSPEGTMRSEVERKPDGTADSQNSCVSGSPLADL